MLRHVLHRVGLGLSTPIRIGTGPLSNVGRLGIGRLGRGTVVNVLRATSPESFLSRLIVRLLGGRLSFNFVSSFVSLSIYLLRNAGFIVGYLLISEIITLLSNPITGNTFFTRLLNFLRSEQNPTMDPLLTQSISN